jgi:hypothetical protein
MNKVRLADDKATSRELVGIVLERRNLPYVARP